MNDKKMSGYEEYYPHINIGSCANGFGWYRHGDCSTNTISNYLGEIDREVQSMQGKLDIAKHALEFYKEEDNHDSDMVSIDYGEMANEALAKINETTPRRQSGDE